MVAPRRNDRAMPIAPVARLARAVRKLAIVGVAAALAIVIALLEDGVELLDVIAAGIASAPPVVLFLLAAALRGLAELPDRVRALPQDARTRAGTLASVAQEAAAGGLLRLPRL